MNPRFEVITCHPRYTAALDVFLVPQTTSQCQHISQKSARGTIILPMRHVRMRERNKRRRSIKNR